MFAKGLKKKMKREEADIYSPADEMLNGPALRNVSGSDKVAMAGMGAAPKALKAPTLQPPKEPIRGLRTGLKQMSVPKRVTPDLSPYGAPKGASGVSGVANSHPFQKSMGRFGRKPRLGLKSFTRLKRGM